MHNFIADIGNGADFLKYFWAKWSRKQVFAGESLIFSRLNRKRSKVQHLHVQTAFVCYYWKPLGELDEVVFSQHVMWRGSVSVGVRCQGSKTESAGHFQQSFSVFFFLWRRTDEPQEWRNTCLRLQPRSVLASFGVVLVSCRVNFHVVRSALQNSMCLLR